MNENKTSNQRPQGTDLVLMFTIFLNGLGANISYLNTFAVDAKLQNDNNNSK